MTDTTEHDRRQAARTAVWLTSAERDECDLETVCEFLAELRLDGSDTGLPARAIEMLAAVSRMANCAYERHLRAAQERYAEVLATQKGGAS